MLTNRTSGDTLSRVRKLVLFIATGLGTGYVPVMPGTAGSLVGAAFYLALSHLPPWLYAVTLVGLFSLAVWAAGRAEDIFEERDCRRIVIDEVIGMLVTLAFLPPTIRNVIAGFLLFRALDIVKPPPAFQINRRMYGGWGVVLDDVVAGLYAGIVMRFL